MGWTELLQKSRTRRAQMADLVINKRMVVKGAAFELGLNPKTAEFHLAQAKLQITKSTTSLLSISDPDEKGQR